MDEPEGGKKLARQIVTREKVSELLGLALRWARMSFFRGLWKSSSKHKSELSLQSTEVECGFRDGRVSETLGGALFLLVIDKRKFPAKS